MASQEPAKNLFGKGQEMTALGAVKEAFKEGLGAMAEGAGTLFGIAQASPVINDMANHGRSEIAAALFGKTDAHVMYMRGSHDQPGKEQAANDNTNEQGKEQEKQQSYGR